MRRGRGLTELCSVIALSKLYDLDDPRLAQIMVKGDLVVSRSTRIMTRSRARQSTPARLSFASPLPLLSPSHQIPSNPPPTDPDQYTIIPAPLKIIKVLIEELSPSALDPSSALLNSTSLDADDDEPASDADDDADWEDDPNELDLGLGATKAQLMAYADADGPGAGGSRLRDDETQAWLLQWFAAQASSARFAEWFAALSPEDQEKLRAFG